MKIVLMRHGEAGFDAPSDDDRQLTSRGRQMVEEHIARQQQELMGIACLLSSPILRARQTADIARQVLQRQDEILEVAWLVHECKPRESIMALADFAANRNLSSLLLFSHQPFASRFVETLCDLPPGEIAMPTASMVAMEVDPVAAGFGQVLWQIS